VPALLGELQRRHPDVEIQMWPSPGGSLDLLEELGRGAIDVAFVSVIDDPPGVEVAELGSEALYLVGACELMPTRRPTVKLPDLAQPPSSTSQPGGAYGP
jgi:DNA-binding transcriptional LysR family regulator